MARTFRRQRSCVYCGAVATERDHVPPRLLFEKPRPSDLVTVPACGRCNRGFATDDEYARVVLALRHDVNAPTAQDRAFATLRHSGGLRSSFLEGVREVSVRTAGGVYLGRAGSYDVNLERLQRTTDRIIRGLFYHERGRALSLEAGVASWEEQGFFQSPIDEGTRALAQTMARDVAKGEAKRIGGGVFVYRYVFTSEHEFASAWLLTFFETIHVLGVTVPA